MDGSRIGFIGGGNMARSLISGLIASGLDADRIVVADPSPQQLAQFAESAGITTTTDNRAAVRDSDVVVLAVKPQVMDAALASVSEELQANQPLLVSIAAGITIDTIVAAAGYSAAVVRCMPNTPALVQSGATALYANAAVTEAQRRKAESIMRSVGIVQWLAQESLMDAVTAVSGSGPAYFFLLMEGMEKTAKELGLPADTARLLTLQTAFGAAHMALESEDDVATLRQRVTSPNGTTAAALAVLTEGRFDDLVKAAVTAACERSRELSGGDE